MLFYNRFSFSSASFFVTSFNLLYQFYYVVPNHNNDMKFIKKDLLHIIENQNKINQNKLN